MSLIKQNITKLLGPKNAQELCVAIALSPDEGVEVCVFPSEPTKTRLGDATPCAPGVDGIPVFATFEHWGERLIDIVTEPPSAVRWWRVRDYMQVTPKVDLVPVSWQGAAGDIPERFFSELHLGIRLFSEGPWFWPMKASYMEDNLKVLEGFVTRE